MQRVQVYNVAPSIPREIRALEALAQNLWWCWNLDAIEVFRRIDPARWKQVGRNPLVMLRRTPQEELEVLSRDKGFIAHLKQVVGRFEVALGRPVNAPVPDPAEFSIAYFSLEFGIHECCRFYSGGLGVLAGDHLKAASDIRLPIAGVGLMYRQGYFQQYLNEDGWQQERFPDIDVQDLPLTRVAGKDGKDLLVSVPLPEGPLRAAVMRLEVGSVPLILLDSNVPENPPELRGVTSQLYGGDRRARLRQEVLLGVGGMRALLAIGITPQVCHINEGHAAFLTLGRLEHLKQTLGIDIETASEIVQRTNVFTTHTPVPAGNETFATDLILPHLQALERETGIPANDVLRWGQDGEASRHELSMTILGLRFAHHSNGVSKLHGAVARRMWRHLWRGRAEDETPIRHVTNGIHVSSWLSAENAALFDRYLGPNWREDPAGEEIVSHVRQIPDEDLWRAHEIGGARLIRSARDRMESQYAIRNARRDMIEAVRSVFDHDTLTIGFARRFAAYKRGTLLLHDRARLEALLTNTERPIQIIFAGKAHPADDVGKDLMRQLVHFARNPAVRHRLIFLENYDIGLARYLVQGVDVWLNTPRRPQEASGTSGMKAAVNGGLHASVLDGWWCEGYTPDCGWAIGRGEEYDDPRYHDEVEAHALYNLLEDEIIPCFYERKGGGDPRRWIGMMKASMAMALRYFTSRRMVHEYRTLFYDPGLHEYKHLVDAGAARAVELVRQRRRFIELWPHVTSEMPTPDQNVADLHVGDRFTLRARVRLGQLRPDEVAAEIYYGPVDAQNVITSSHVERMSMVEQAGEGQYVYTHDIVCRSSGRYGFTTRLTPKGAEWAAVMPGFMTWADGSSPV